MLKQNSDVPMYLMMNLHYTCYSYTLATIVPTYITVIIYAIV